MIAKYIEEENGKYIGTDGKRYTILIAEAWIDTPEGRNVGCVEVASEEEFANMLGFKKVEENTDEILDG